MRRHVAPTIQGIALWYFAISCPSNSTVLELLRDLLPQNAGRSKDQEQDQQGKNGRPRPGGGKILIAQGRQTADEIATQDRPGDIADSPHHGGGKRLKPGVKAHE